MTPSGVGLIVSAVSVLRRKNAGWMTCETIIATTPATRNTTAMMNGGPMPNQDVPEAEFAGRDRCGTLWGGCPRYCAVGAGAFYRATLLGALTRLGLTERMPK